MECYDKFSQNDKHLTAHIIMPASKDSPFSKSANK